VYRVSDQAGGSSHKRAGDSDAKQQKSKKKTGAKPRKDDSSSLPDWLPALLTMVQSTGSPHYPYWSPHQPGFNGNSATNCQSPDFGTGQSPGFGAGQSSGNATEGFYSSKAMPFGQFGVLSRRTMMPPLLPPSKSRTNHLQSAETQSPTSEVEPAKTQSLTSKVEPAEAQFQTNHMQSVHALFPSNHLQSAQFPTSDVLSAQFPSNNLQSAETQSPYNQVQSLNSYGLPTFSQPLETDTGAPSKKSQKGSHTLLNRKRLMEATAGSLVSGGVVSYFICPLRSCPERLHPDATLEELWDHCSDSQHSMGLFHQDHYRCEIGCQERFADSVQRLSHYSKARCTNEELPDDRCFERGCTWIPTQPSGKGILPSRAKFLQHYITKHAREANDKHDAPFQDDICNLGFRSKATLFYHVVGGCAPQGTLLGRNRVSGHRDRVLEEFNAGANIVSDGSRPIDHDLPAIFPLEIRGEHVEYDPIMCRPAGASPSSQRVVQDGD
jgi:hypothetical protein